MAMHINEGNFYRLTNSDIPVIVDFWAPWCGPCKMLGPVIEDVGRTLRGKAKIAKINIDENPDIARQYRISSVPTVLVFKNGRVVDQFVGFIPKSAIMSRLQRYIY